MVKGCTPDNVIGAMNGLAEARNGDVPFTEIEDDSPSSHARFYEQVDRAGAMEHDSSAKPDQVISTLNHWAGDPLNTSKKLLNDLRNPSGIFGEEYIQPVHQYIVEHHQAFADDLFSKEAKSAYYDGIEEVINSLPDLHPDLEYAADRYKSFYMKGGELYGRDQGNAVIGAGSSLVKNTLQNSPTVITGNVFEGAIKLPTFYPTTLLPAIGKALQESGGNIFGKIPELEAKGVYGSSLGLEDATLGSRFGGILKEGLIGITDNPLKNIAYFAGELADGDGLKAVQKIAFVPRFGDTPMVYYHSGSRLAVQFLGYTINTYKMYAQMYKDLFNPATAPTAARQLITYHAMAGLIGGAGAALPQPIVEMIKRVAPDTEEWFDENRSPVAGLIQPGNIDRVFITGELASRQIKKLGGSILNTSEALGEGDTTTAIIEGVDTLLNALPFTNSPLGDAQVQKIKNIGKQVALEELDIEDAIPTAIEKINPFR